NRTYGGRVGRLFKGEYHLKGGKVSKIASARRRARLVRIDTRKFAKILTRQSSVSRFYDTVPRAQRVVGRGFRTNLHQNMRGANLLFQAVIGDSDEAVNHRDIAEVWLKQLCPVSLVLLTETCCGIHSTGDCFGH